MGRAASTNPRVHVPFSCSQRPLRSSTGPAAGKGPSIRLFLAWCVLLHWVQGGSPCVPSGARGTGYRGSGQIQSCFLRIHCAAPVPWLHLPAGEAGKRRLYSGPAFPLLKTGGYYYTEEAKADAGGPRRLPTPCSPYRYLCFTDNDPEAQRDEVSCSKAHSFFKLPSLPPGRHPL